MTKRQKLFQVSVGESFGFELVRINSSPHIFQHPALSEQISPQNPNQIQELFREELEREEYVTDVS